MPYCNFTCAWCLVRVERDGGDLDAPPTGFVRQPYRGVMRDSWAQGCSAAHAWLAAEVYGDPIGVRPEIGASDHAALGSARGQVRRA